MWADCNRQINPVQCECCTVCCDPLSNCSPVTDTQSYYGYGNITDDENFFNDAF